MLRKAVKADLDSCVEGINTAKLFLKSKGIDQWQDGGITGYPNREALEKDIELDRLYVFEIDNKIAGVTVIQTAVEETYQVIYDGAWRLEQPYVTLHRFAIASQFSGKKISHLFLVAIHHYVKNILGYRYIRIDTHFDNIYMQNLLLQNAYHLCGYILLNQAIRNPKRLAFDCVVI